MRRSYWAEGAVLFALAIPGCLVTTSLSGLSDGVAPAVDGGGTDAQSLPDSALPDVEYASCAAAKAALPNAKTGTYTLKPGGAVAAFRAYCDMTDDDGGWMLVTPEMIASEESGMVTFSRSMDVNGGLVLRVYANAEGCENPGSWHKVLVADRPVWTRIRVREVFAGGTACWWIFGAMNPEEPHGSNVAEFTQGQDTSRAATRMGGASGDAFDGRAERCDNDVNNFWHRDRGVAPRSVVAILRRKAGSTEPAGLATTVSCTEFAPSTTSPTYWEYRDIYVR